MGCNFRCDFCQNWQISQLPRVHEKLVGRSHTPEEIVQAANAPLRPPQTISPSTVIGLDRDSERLFSSPALAATPM